MSAFDISRLVSKRSRRAKNSRVKSKSSEMIRPYVLGVSSNETINDQEITNKTFSNQGMSLVEVLVALVFISMAVAMFAYFVDALRINQDSKKETAAALFAKDYMESLRAKWRSLDDYQKLALATPGNIPIGYDLEINIKNEQGNVIYAYPGGTAGEDDSLMRVINVQFSDSQEKMLALQSVLARPTPVYQSAENHNQDHHDEEDD